MRFADLPLRILLLKSESNLENHVRWMAYLAGNDFVNDWKKSIKTGGHLQHLIESARQMVDELIYAFSTGESTGALRESFTGKYLDTALPAFAVYSDPKVAPSKGPFASGIPSDFSYAAFFEDPKFNSFLPDRENPTETRRYRPFFDVMTSDQKTQSQEIVFAALMQTIRKRMPRV